MNLHLVEIAQTVEPGAHAVLLVDQAGWHMSTHLIVPPNITIIGSAVWSLRAMIQTALAASYDGQSNRPPLRFYAWWGPAWPAIPS